MENNVEEVLEYIKENDVKFVKLFFTDLFARTRSISLQPDEVRGAFEEGIAFDASKEAGFLNYEDGDLYLKPDGSTLSLLPWRPEHGRVARLYCNIFNDALESFEGDSRAILKRQEDEGREAGIAAKISEEAQFYLFLLDAKGEPTKLPHDSAGRCDLAPLDKGENVRRAICTTLRLMGVTPRLSLHEGGPGQHKVDFKASSFLEAADNFVTFRNATKSVANQSGLCASFSLKPFVDSESNSLSLNLLITQGDDAGDSGEVATYFAAGLMRRMREICTLLNPQWVSGFWLNLLGMSKKIAWSKKNLSSQGHLLRLSCVKGQKWLKLRFLDSQVNPYIALSLIERAGLEGIKQKIALPEDSESSECLPETLADAINLVQNSQFVKSIISPRVLDAICTNSLKVSSSRL